LGGWWVSDFKSFICQEKAILSIDAVEDSEVLLLSVLTMKNY
jgi:hypothetical protein